MEFYLVHHLISDTPASQLAAVQPPCRPVRPIAQHTLPTSRRTRRSKFVPLDGDVVRTMCRRTARSGLCADGRICKYVFVGLASSRQCQMTSGALPAAQVVKFVVHVCWSCKEDAYDCRRVPTRVRWPCVAERSRTVRSARGSHSSAGAPLESLEYVW